MQAFGVHQLVLPAQTEVTYFVSILYMFVSNFSGEMPQDGIMSV